MRRGRVRPRRKKRSFFPIFLLFLLILIGAGAFFAYTSPLFEKEPPKILAPNNIYTNATSPIEIKIEDNIKVKSAEVIINSNGKEIPVFSQTFMLPTKSKIIKIDIPKDLINSKNLVMSIVAKDGSLWNFFTGNKTIKSVNVKIDKTPPLINVLANSTYITKGGSSLVIFKVNEESLKNLYVDVGDNIKFKPIKYKKDGVFVSLFAWPFNKDNINPTIVAIDSANNISKVAINILKKQKNYKISKIKATDKFINGKITELLLNDSEFSSIKDKFKKFRAVNELMRKKNEDLIHKYSKKVTPVDNWNIKPFYPLKGAKKISDFGVKRFYYYGSPDNIISTSYHVGYDFASVKHANLYATNPGIVVFAGYNGIYGNMPLIDHGLGLYTLYGHCSSILVKKGQKVNRGQVIAKTGSTGLALGDHVHFGVLVQGIEVHPLEWMSKSWLKTHISDVFKKADKILGYN